MIDSTTILLISLLLAPSLNFLPLIAASQVIEVPGDYANIRSAILAANPGDTIKVDSGTYSENLEITKSLKLIGEGPANTVIVGNGTVVLVKADNVEISGFTVGDGTYGIFLWYCSGALLRNNVMAGNRWNFGIWGDVLAHFVHDIDSSNLAEGKPIYFWLNKHDKSVPKDAGYVALVNSSRINVEDVQLTSNEQGVLLVNTHDTVIENTTMLGNDEGIALRMSNNNTIRMNNLISINWHAIYCLSSHNNSFTENLVRNGTYCISILQSSGNVIYHNNFLHNKWQLDQANSFNTWDNGTQGNYWSDYTGTDTDHDGVGDTMLPHLGADYHPLISIFDKTPPTANAGENQTVPRNTPVFLNASGSSDNIAVVSYKWDFGDGSDGTGITTTHVYNATGVYTVTLTVADAFGNVATDRIVLTVANSPTLFPRHLLFVLVGSVAIILMAGFWLRRYVGTKRTKDKR